MAEERTTSARLGEQRALVSDGLLTIGEACAFLRVSRATLYTLMDRGELAFVKVGRARRVPKRAVIEFAASLVQGGGRAHAST